MYSKYRCLNCGRIWRSREILVICPVCKSKPRGQVFVAISSAPGNIIGMLRDLVVMIK